MTPSFSNPVVGAIRPPSSPAIFGSFRVTAAFGAVDADHPSVNPDGTRGHQGVDVGNMKCGDPILAMSDGIVEAAFTSVSGAIIIRVDSSEYPGYQFAAAHVAGIEVVKGQKLKRGQPYAHIGKTGTTGCHLHGGMKLNGQEVDWWPLLAQNQQKGDMLQGKPILQIVNRQTTVLGSGTRFRPSPGTTQPELVKLAAGTLFYPEWLVDGELVLGSSQWYGAWQNTPNGIAFGYLSEKLVGPLTPIEATAGHSDAELLAATTKAAADAANEVANAAALKANTIGSKKV